MKRVHVVGPAGPWKTWLAATKIPDSHARCAALPRARISPSHVLVVAHHHGGRLRPRRRAPLCVRRQLGLHLARWRAVLSSSFSFSFSFSARAHTSDCSCTAVALVATRDSSWSSTSSCSASSTATSRAMRACGRRRACRRAWRCRHGLAAALHSGSHAVESVVDSVHCVCRLVRAFFAMAAGVDGEDGG